MPIPKSDRELANYAASLAVDLNDDGKPDKKGYEIFFKKIEFKYDEYQSIEEFQKQIQEYISNIEIWDDLKKLNTEYSSMFTEKDYDMYFGKIFNCLRSKMKKE